MKPIYVVENVDCGIIGVFGNLKGAYTFVAQRQEEMYGDDDLASGLDKSYSQISREIRDTVRYPVCPDFEAETSITCFELNRTDY